ncbi:layilin [Electrophorus electricus]|uniref:layilin n=1 Tax=Electrophorus electricus TaxID=8005 RepID=UPI0015D08F18|nr:layilin [Electrophorus electricus]
MEFMKLIGTVLAVCYHTGYALEGFASQRICRRGTEKPCYKIVYQQDLRLRVSFDVARRACRDDRGELLSIETENEQRLVERFVLDLRAPDGDFWIGLRRSLASTESAAGDCSSRYYWLDQSQATFRHWLLKEPSCGSELCGALYHRTSSLAHYMLKWTDTNCNAKNNFICKYSAEKSPAATPAGNSTTHSDIPKISLKPKRPPVTLNYEKINKELPKSSVSLSDESISVYYVLMAGMPLLLMVILLASGFFCYRVLARKRKEPNHIYAEPGPWVSARALQNHGGRPPLHDPGPRTACLEYMSSEINGNISATGPGCHGDYENLPSGAAGFVTNDIYETCRSPLATEAGWVDNDIYGY